MLLNLQGLLLSAKGMCQKPLVVYPNSGERYQKDTGEWTDLHENSAERFNTLIPIWLLAGAKAVGQYYDCNHLEFFLKELC